MNKRHMEKEVDENIGNAVEKPKKTGMKQLELTDDDLAYLGKNQYSERAKEFISRRHKVDTEWHPIPGVCKMGGGKDNSGVTFDGDRSRGARYFMGDNGRTFLAKPKDWSKEPPFTRATPGSKILTTTKILGN